MTMDLATHTGGEGVLGGVMVVLGVEMDPTAVRAWQRLSTSS